MKDKKEKRIFIKCVKPTICKHQKSDITEYHDGNYDIDVWCGLSKKRIKCNQSNCEKKEYSGIPYDTAIDKMAKAIYSEMEEATRPYISTISLNARSFAEVALNALLEEWDEEENA